MQNSAARKREEEGMDGSVVSITKFKKTPVHWEFRDLKEQLRKLVYARPEAALDPQPFANFLDSRDWASARLPGRAQGLAVVRRVTGSFEEASRATMRHLSTDIWLTDYTPQRTRRSSSFIALMRQWQNFDYMVIAVQMGCEHHGCSGEQAESRFGPMEFGLGLLEGLDVLEANPGRLDSSRDLGIDFVGDRLGEGIMPSLSIENRRRVLRAKSISRPDFGFGSASAFFIDSRDVPLK